VKTFAGKLATPGEPSLTDLTTAPEALSALAAHDKELLAIPGVVGVYVGTLEDRRTPCLRVMLARKTPASARKAPRSIEGYPVITEVTGEIRPLGKP
jgi:hypothetical protein